jgi:hypothetical protein
VEALMNSANSAGGLQLVPEPHRPAVTISAPQPQLFQ